MLIDEQRVRERIVHTLDELPSESLERVLNFVDSLRKPERPESRLAHQGLGSLRLVPASSLVGLTGVVSLGGDALADSEALYNGHSECSRNEDHVDFSSCRAFVSTYHKAAKPQPNLLDTDKH
jgi:hypothetical protein